jgi:hypothetical protein
MASSFGRIAGKSQRVSNTFGSTAEPEKTGGYANVHLFKPTCRPEKMFWDDKGDRSTLAVTTFRLLPEFAPTGYFPARQLDVAGMPEFTGWLIKYRTFKLPSPKERPGGGSFIVYDPEDDAFGPRARWDNPAAKLLQAIDNAQKAEQGEPYWYNLTNKKNRDRIEWPAWSFFAYGLMHGLGEGITRIVRKPRAGNEGIFDTGAPIDADVDTLFDAPDPVDLAGGLIFRAYQLGTKNPRDFDQQPLPNGKLPWLRLVPRDPSEEAPSIGYSVYAVRKTTLLGGREDEPIVVKPQIGDEHWEQLSRRYAAPIRDHLIFPTYEEQVAKLVENVRRAGGDYCGSLFRHAFKDDEGLLAVVEDALSAVEVRRATFDPNTREDRKAVRAGTGKAAEARRPAPSDEDVCAECELPLSSCICDRDDDEATSAPSRRPAPVEDDDDGADDDDNATQGFSRNHTMAGHAELDENGDDVYGDDIDPVAGDIDENDVDPVAGDVDEDDDDPDAGDTDTGEDDLDSGPAPVQPPPVTPSRAARPVGRTGQPLKPVVSLDDEPPAPTLKPGAAPVAKTPQQKLQELKSGGKGSKAGK